MNLDIINSMSWSRYRQARWCLLAVALWLVGCASARPETVDVLKIGVLAPLSGDFEPLGRRVRDGVLLAVEAQNGTGGVLGRQVQVVLEDTQCDYFGGREATQAAIDEGARFLIGAVCAEASEGVAQVATEAGALQISPAALDLDLTLDGNGDVRDLVYRLPVPDVTQGAAAAAFAKERLGAERAGILYPEEGDYGLTLAEAFRTAFEDAGGEVVIRQAYDQDAELFFEVLEAVRDENPDVLYLPGYHTVMNRLVAQARQFGLLQPIVGSDGWHSASLDRVVTDGCYFTTQYFAGEPRAVVQGWVQLYEARYLSPPDALATMSFDAANLMFQAIETAGFLEPTLVAQALGDLTYEGVSGTITFDASHNPTKPLLVLRVDPAGFIFQGRFAQGQDETPNE